MSDSDRSMETISRANQSCLVAGRILRSSAAGRRARHTALSENELRSAESRSSWFMRESGSLAVGDRSVRRLGGQRVGLHRWNVLSSTRW
jgi:hypothetical protein